MDANTMYAYAFLVSSYRYGTIVPGQGEVRFALPYCTIGTVSYARVGTVGNAIGQSAPSSKTVHVHIVKRKVNITPKCTIKPSNIPVARILASGWKIWSAMALRCTLSGRRITNASRSLTCWIRSLKEANTPLGTMNLLISPSFQGQGSPSGKPSQDQLPSPWTVANEALEASSPILVVE